MNKRLLLILALATYSTSSVYAADLYDYNASPDNWYNSQNNWENSPNNWKNSPNNFDNSPYKLNNQHIIRDENGQATGYIVPKTTGGANIFDMNGNRKAYVPR